ncbi:NUDIX domain-containing protein [Paenibacillus sp. MB22_1]|uniref:NUDIX domain-containing protein n=1 Tax=Paenibacillus sp. MB22_1 TaxID=3383121 RepID=UPI0039A0A973
MSEYYKNIRNKIGPDLLFIPSVAAIIRNEKNDILFIRKKGETIWGLPAGAIEIGESPSESIKREVYEETGLIIHPKRIIGVFGGDKYRYEYTNGHKVEYIVTIFECSIRSGELSPVDGEAEELRYYAEEEIPPIAIPLPKEIFIKKLSKDKTIFE